ncbi:PD-(D/E)XK nuclease family protein [Croceivirga thetidis]|uniref:PD-(D/E)XK endonuclease-like domain-containing protein n=1 Tax=Croceivirga thetidis TaxID=2721623 RepID=A0ABX1GN55_9FLAO|nr:PD-(D/E)XK nuclease family protein [Croceivirga thetidis]NKI31366.1 hypothetical protein [Croceivirga thetidis]
MPGLFCFMQSFLNRVIDDILLEYKTLEHTVFILPSNRSIRALKKLLANKYQTPIFSPAMLSVEQFIKEVSGLETADELEQQFVLFDLYKSLNPEENDTFSVFSGWSNTILGDFNEIDRYLIAHEKLYGYLEAIERIKNWNPNNVPTKLIKEYAKFSAKASQLYEKYRKELIDQKKGSQGIQYCVASEKISEFVSSNTEKSFFIIGLNALNEAEKYIFNFLLEHTNSKIYWDLDDHFRSDSIHEAGYFYRKNRNYFIKNAAKQLLCSTNDYLKKQHISIIGAPKNTAQAQYVGKLLEEIDINTKPVALVLADETLLPLLLNSIPPHIKNLNVSMGYPLQLSIIIKFVESILKLKKSLNEKGYPYQEVLNFLSMPTTGVFVSDGKCSALSKNIKKHNLIYIDAPSFKDFLSDPTFEFLFVDNLKASEFIQSIREILKIVSNKKDLSSIEKEAISQLENFLIGYYDSITAYPFLEDINSFELVLNSFISKGKLNFRGNPDKGLQVMGVLETRALDFETVIVTSLNEGILPAGKAVNSFIPYDVKKEFGLPTVKEKDAIYTYHFYRLLQRAKNVYLTYNTEPDVLNGGQPSRFIHQLLADPNLEPFITHKLVSPKFNYKKKQANQISKTPLLLSELAKKLENGLSPSSLSVYIKNPYQFYKRHILKIGESENVDENVAYNILGTIVHDSLESIYKLLPKKSLQEEDFTNLLPFVESHILSHFQKHYDKSAIYQGKNLILYNVLIKYIQSVIKRDKVIALSHDFKILSLEESLIATISESNANTPFVLKGKLDRIDEIDGTLRIIDYKTGTVNTSGLKIDAIEPLFSEPKYSQAFQLLCYVLLKRKNGTVLNEAGILAVKKPNEKIHLLTRAKEFEHPCSDIVIDQFEERLNLLYEEILNPEIPFIDTGE